MLLVAHQKEVGGESRERKSKPPVTVSCPNISAVLLAVPRPGRWSSGGVERKTVREEKICEEVKGMKRIRESCRACLLI